MTIKELAEVAGCNEKTVRKVGKELFPLEFKNGVRTVFAKSQCFDIMAKLPKKNLIQMSEQPNQNIQGSSEVMQMFQMMMEQNQKFMSSVLGEIKNINRPSLPAPIEQDYFSLTAYCSVKNIKLNHSEALMHGRYLKKLSKEKESVLRKIPDERWGFVNSYPVELLNEYFSL